MFYLRTPCGSGYLDSVTTMSSVLAIVTHTLTIEISVFTLTATGFGSALG